MTAIKFTVPEVDAKFTTAVEVDTLVHKAGVYSGKLSNISLPMAEGMVTRKSNLIALKDAAKEKPAATKQDVKTTTDQKQ